MAKQKNKTTSGPVTEPTAYAEIGGYLYENEGKATVKMHTSVNSPLKTDDAARATRIKKVRVEMNVVEDKDVKDNQVYQKDVTMTQIVNDDPAYTNSQSTGGPVENDPNAQPNNGPLSTEGHFLKNMVDNLWADMRQNKITSIVGLCLGAAALALGVGAIIIALI